MVPVSTVGGLQTQQNSVPLGPQPALYLSDEHGDHCSIPAQGHPDVSLQVEEDPWDKKRENNTRKNMLECMAEKMVTGSAGTQRY